jgi:2-haloacid dehalogenase
MNLTSFQALTFDCYGTLIDWESGIFAALQPLLRGGGPARNAALEAFARHESAQEAETPGMLYPEVLARVHRRLAAEWSLPATEADHLAFGASVPDWPAFPDSAEALRYLQGFYKLVILSNVDRTSFAASNARLGVTFDAVYTAEDIGSYKPDPANFRYMLDALAARGLPPAAILHTAQSLFHDHAPARKFGLATAWIDRRHESPGWGATMPQAEAGYDLRFTSMAELAEAHRAALAAQG